MYICINIRNRCDNIFFIVGKNVFGNGIFVLYYVLCVIVYEWGILYIYLL